MNKELLESFKLCICGRKREFEVEAIFSKLNKTLPRQQQVTTREQQITSEIKTFQFCGKDECFNELTEDFEARDIIYSLNGHTIRYIKDGVLKEVGGSIFKRGLTPSFRTF
jgi:hypothetical protein